MNRPSVARWIAVGVIIILLGINIAATNTGIHQSGLVKKQELETIEEDIVLDKTPTLRAGTDSDTEYWALLVAVGVCLDKQNVSAFTPGVNIRI